MSRDRWSYAPLLAGLGTLLFVFGGCDSGPDEITETRFDEGSACVRSLTPTASKMIQPGDELVVEIFSDCVPCGGAVEDLSCEAALVESQILVFSSARVTTPTTQPKACFSACRKATAECELGPVPAGNYALRLGRRVWPIEVPGPIECPPR